MKNILDYYKIPDSDGVVLDQTPTENTEKVTQPVIRIVTNKSELMKNALRLIRTIKRSDELFGYTLTFKKEFNTQDPKKLHRYVISKLKRSTLWKKYRYVMFPEFGGKNGDLHYHGVIECPYQLNFSQVMKMWQRLFGFVQKEFTIRHYDCHATFCKFVADDPSHKGCWTHYCIKNVGKVGLWPLHNLLFSENISILFPT